MQETPFQSLDMLEKETATHSSILPGESNGPRSLVGYKESTGLQRVRHCWARCNQAAFSWISHPLALVLVSNLVFHVFCPFVFFFFKKCFEKFPVISQYFYRNFILVIIFSTIFLKFFIFLQSFYFCASHSCSMVVLPWICLNCIRANFFLKGSSVSWINSLSSQCQLFPP